MDWHLTSVPCTTCGSGAPVAVHPAWVNRARCGPCVAAGVPAAGELVPVAERVTEPDRDWPAYFAALGGRHKPVKRADLTLPEPEHTSRDPWPEDIAVPTGAARLKAWAEGQGWSAEATYSRGHRWGVGAAMVRVHQVAVRLSGPGERRAVMVWEAKADAAKLAWTCTGGYRWGRDSFPAAVALEELKADLKATGAGGLSPVR